MSSILDQLWFYVILLIEAIPLSTYVGTAFLSFIGMVSFVIWKGWIKGLRYSAAFFLTGYSYLLLGSTIFFRSSFEEDRYNFTPFWSYRAIQKGVDYLLPENIMNVMVFLPVGFLLGCALVNIKWQIVLLIGFGLSVSIEIMQYLFKCGFSEIDDVIHNSLGCFLGYLLFKGAKLMVQR